jgi:molecular chaperone HscA
MRMASLTIQAIELRSGVKQEVEVKPTYGITDEQVEQMLMDSITHAKDDVSQRMLIEARTEGEQMVYTVERFCKRMQLCIHYRNSEQTKLISGIKRCLTSGDKDLILKSIDEVNEFTRPFAERLMDQAISTAMRGKSIE